MYVFYKVFGFDKKEKFLIDKKRNHVFLSFILHAHILCEPFKIVKYFLIFIHRKDNFGINLKKKVILANFDDN